MKSERVPFVEDLRFRGRNWRYRELFGSLQRHHLGTVLDVGGGHFVEATTDRPISCDLWVVVEPDRRRLPERRNGVGFVIGDGLELAVRSCSIDTVVAIQVLEHVYEPIVMMEEMHRVLRPGGEIIVVVPQTANVHELPHHYQNFTRYWLEETARRLDLEVVMYQPLGGAWSSIASRLLLHYGTVLRLPGHHEPRSQRGIWHRVLAPVAALTTVLVVPIAMLLSLADLEEEANNHLMVLRRPL